MSERSIIKRASLKLGKDEFAVFYRPDGTSVLTRRAFLRKGSRRLKTTIGEKLSSDEVWSDVSSRDAKIHKIALVAASRVINARFSDKISEKGNIVTAAQQESIMIQRFETLMSALQDRVSSGSRDLNGIRRSALKARTDLKEQ